MPSAFKKTVRRLTIPLSAGSLTLCLCLLTPARSSRSRTQPLPAVRFVDITKASGIDFLHFKGNNGTSTILEEAGPGVCVADYDGDGFQGTYFVNGADRY